jgi:hypothetical protein
LSFLLSPLMTIKARWTPFHQQFAVYDNGAEVVGPLRADTLARLTLADGQAAPL